jgi:hypothetical protein
MPKDKISQYAFTPAANTDIGGINIDEGCAPSGINNAIRTLMTQIRDLQAGVSGDTVPLTAGGTGSGTAASARAALGLAIGTNVLGYVTPGASGNILLSDGSNWTSVAQSAVITLDTITGGPLALDKGGTNATTAAQARTNLGVVIGTDVLGYVTAGATGQVLTSTGTGWTSGAATGGQLKTELFTSSGTWTNPGAVTQVTVTVVGGGGSGGRNPSTGRAGGFGGLAIASVPVSGPVTVTIGAGGAGASASPSTPGNAGGTSSFGPLVSATGGGGGTVGPTSVVGTPGAGTVSSGTALRVSSSSGLTVQVPSTADSGGFGHALGGLFSASLLRPIGTATPLAWSATQNFAAGAASAGGGPGVTSGGVDGAILVEFVG